MSDEEWESATANARDFLAQRLEHSREFAHVIWGTEDPNDVDEIFNDYLSYVTKSLEKGDLKSYHRRKQKRVMEQNGRELPFWSSSIFTTSEQSLLHYLRLELQAVKENIVLENISELIMFLIEHTPEEKIPAAKEQFITNLCRWSE